MLETDSANNQISSTWIFFFEKNFFLTDKEAEPEGGENHGQGNRTWEEAEQGF